jgi:hypothetical protein
MDLTTLVPLIAGLIGHTWLTVLLLNRRVYRSFPVFVCYQAYAALAVTARIVPFLAQAPQPYFFTFWSTELGFVVLAIAASHEVFRWVFSGFYRLPWFRAFYYGGIGITIAIVGINSLLHAPLNVHPLVGRILPFVIVINGIQAAIFALFFLLVKLLDIGFRRYAFGIALGLGIASVGTLIPYVARSIFGTELENFFLYAPTVAYFVSILVWLSAFMKAQPEEDAIIPPMRPEEMAEEVGQYVVVLKGFFGKK